MIVHMHGFIVLGSATSYISSDVLARIYDPTVALRILFCFWNCNALHIYIFTRFQIAIYFVLSFINLFSKIYLLNCFFCPLLY